MSDISYLNLDLKIGQAGAAYYVLLSGPECETTQTVTFTLPPEAQEWSDAASRRLKHDKAKEIGRKLFEMVIRDSASDCFYENLKHTQSLDKTGMRIRLKLDPVPELQSLPWELLYEPKEGVFLNQSALTPIVRFPRKPRSTSVNPIIPPLRILVVIASPEGYGKLDTDAEWKYLSDKLAQLELTKAVKLTKLAAPTFEGLRAELERSRREGDYHILHFIGHGYFDKDQKTGFLLFEGDSPAADPKVVSGEMLGVLLRDYKSVRVAFLNACESAKLDTRSPSASVAGQLADQGIECVVGMYSSVADHSAALFARGFYGSLDGNFVDDAAAQGRRALFVEYPAVIEWSAPILYNGLDWKLFEFTHDWEKRADLFMQGVDKLIQPGEKPTVAQMRTEIMNGLLLTKDGAVLEGERGTRTQNLDRRISLLFDQLKGDRTTFLDSVEDLLEAANEDDWVRQKVALLCFRDVVRSYLDSIRQAKTLFEEYGADTLVRICNEQIRIARELQKSDVELLISKIKTPEGV